jgi:MoaA/NifB/PqqE/SkfB family radical SAM enzyme/ubiquinone/menaquinone biosynthesis C-methylase UbiE
MKFQRELWTRFEADGLPIYVRGDRPQWFVPNTSGDRVLQDWPSARVIGDLQARRFIERLPEEPPLLYPGRDQVLKLQHLRELWFHLTNRCNQACRHCLFASSPSDAAELESQRVRDIASEAFALGCRVFALTGGEPMFYADFAPVVDFLLQFDQTHVMVLTNGLFLKDFAAELDRWPGSRFHLQISLDGLEQNHDRLRGPGAFAALMENLRWLKAQGRTCTLSMCVTQANYTDLPALIDLAGEMGAANFHLIWYFIRGRGTREQFVLPEDIVPQVMEASRRAAAQGISLDNLDILKSQIFAPPGTIYDGAGSGWESLAVGPDGRLYPSPALVGVKDLATNLAPDLRTAWQESLVLQDLRRVTAASLTSPLRFFLGGGDPDHSYLHGGTLVGDDPYIPLYEKLALWLIAQEAAQEPDCETPGLRLRMGEILESCGPHGAVALTHSNCLLTAVTPDSRAAVREFYQDAAQTTKEDILNPVCYPEEFISHIPEEARLRSYGCGSPVLEARLAPGETVLDLGCGTGVECFIASRLVGPAGQVVGVDMLPVMLGRASRGAVGVADHLGYDNLTFKLGFLEDLPLPKASVDVILSNCVINLSSHKRCTFREALRVLKPGGRLVVSDVFTPSEPDPAIKNDDTLRGECIAGALTEKHLFALLEETGFSAMRVLKRFPYRVVQGHPFFSLTFEAVKPESTEDVMVMYRGPLAALVTSHGDLLPVGEMRRINHADLPGQTADFLIFNDAGQVVNVAQDSWSCCAPAANTAAEAAACCCPSPNPSNPASATPPPLAPVTTAPPRHHSGCLVCGAPLNYKETETLARCHYCQAELPANAVCEQGHFVCDACHTSDGLAVIEHVCQTTAETDLIALLDEIRRHPAIPRHGPEHHVLVPAVILTAYRNLGGAVTPETFRTAISRGRSIPGGACGFLGVCGAAAGVGIAFSLLLKATPMKPIERGQVQGAVQAVLGELTPLEAARCCQRESWLALRKAAELSRELLAIPLQAAAPLICRQGGDRPDCLQSRCPLWPGAGL